MEVFTYSDARQRFSSLLKQAQVDGKVLIKRRDGQIFAVTPEEQKQSPLDLEGINTNVTTKDIVNVLRKTRERSR